MSLDNKEVCNQCPNHCPITDLKCPRGRSAMLGENPEDDEEMHHGRHGGHGRDRKSVV